MLFFLDTFLHIYLLICFTNLESDGRSVPLISNHDAKNLTSREKVKEIQLQSMLKTLEKNSKEDENIKSLFMSKQAAAKQNSDDYATEHKQLNQLFDEHIPLEILQTQVPFSALIKSKKNSNNEIEHSDNVNKRESEPSFFDKQFNSLPCRKKRAITDLKKTDKRGLKTPVGEGIFPSYSMYDELCEDAQPVEVVKIDRLVVQNGIIKDQNIIEKAMFT